MTQPALPETGALLAGKYRIVRLLGRGGMGAVYEAQHEVLCRRVALKVLLTDTAASQDGVQRFVNEARAAARLDSEYIARVLDFGTLDSGQPFMVLEYLEGRDLAQTLAARGPLPVPEAVDYILQACEALAQAHATGIVHRDLKPANLYVARRGDGSSRIKVLDFGISKVSDLSLKPQSLTSTSAMLGTPYYMSPEQVATPKLVDSRTDIWQLGVCLHELLSGTPPFVSETLGELMFAILNGTVPPLANSRADVPPGLEQAIRRCLQRDVTRRFASVTELAESIAPFGTGPLRNAARISQTLDAGMGDFAVTPTPQPAPAVQTVNSWGHASAASVRRPSRKAPAVIAAAFVVAVGAAGLLSVGTRSQSGVAPSPSASPPASVAAATSNLPVAPRSAPATAAAVAATAALASSEPVPVAAPTVPAPDEPPVRRTLVAEPTAKPRRFGAPPAKAPAVPPPAPPRNPPSASPSPPTPADEMPDNSRQ